jgi:hypothetical protein
VTVRLETTRYFRHKLGPSALLNEPVPIYCRCRRQFFVSEYDSATVAASSSKSRNHHKTNAANIYELMFKLKHCCYVVILIPPFGGFNITRATSSWRQIHMYLQWVEWHSRWRGKPWPQRGGLISRGPRNGRRLRYRWDAEGCSRDRRRRVESS